MEARNDPVRKAVREFGTQSVSEDDGTRIVALDQCEYVRFLIVAPDQVPADVQIHLEPTCLCV